MRKEIGMYTITSNLKKCKSLGFEELTKKQQENMLQEFGHIEDLEGSYFVLERGELIPMDEITNFTINTIPESIENYFAEHYPNLYRGVGRNGVYLQDSTFFLVEEFQEWYIKFNIS